MGRVFRVVSVLNLVAFVAVGAVPTASAAQTVALTLGETVSVTTDQGAIFDLAATDILLDGAQAMAVDRSTDLYTASPLPQGGVALSAPAEVVVMAAGGAINSMPLAFAGDPVENGGEVRPGLGMSFPLSAAELDGVDPASVAVLRSTAPGGPWVEVPSAYDAATGEVRGYAGSTGTFAVIGHARPSSGQPRVVIDLDNDVNSAVWDGLRIGELESATAVAAEIERLLETNCGVDVVVARTPGSPWVNDDLRLARANAADADLVLRIGMSSGDGLPSGSTTDGGARVWPLGLASTGFAQAAASSIKSYTGRPANAASSGRSGDASWSGVAPRGLYVDLGELDNNYDHAVISTRPDLPALALARSAATELVGLGYSAVAACASTVSSYSPSGPVLVDAGTYSYWLGGTSQPASAGGGSWPSGNIAEYTFLNSSRVKVATIYGEYHVSSGPQRGLRAK